MALSRQPGLVFVSYAHKDAAFALRLVDDLRTCLGPETEVWLDVSRGLAGGDDWRRTIVEKVGLCDIFLCVLSPAALESPPVGFELDMAWIRKFDGRTRIIPLLYWPCEVPLDLSTLQYVSFLAPKGYDAAVSELVSAVVQYIPGPQRAPLRTEVLPALPSSAPAHALGEHPQSPGVEGEPPRILPHIMPTLLLLSINGTAPPRSVTLPGTSFRLGRSPENEIVIPDASVSRHHLQVEWTGQQWQAAALPEAADFWLNGRLARTAPLSSGDQVVIGATILRFELPTLGRAAGTPGTGELPNTMLTTALPPQMMVEGAAFHFVTPLRQAEISVGRAPDRGLVVPSQAVSAHHAVLRRGPDGHYIVEDVGSRNGMYYNGTRVARQVLRSGDRLAIGARMPGDTISFTYSTPF